MPLRVTDETPRLALSIFMAPHVFNFTFFHNTHIFIIHLLIYLAQLHAHYPIIIFFPPHIFYDVPDKKVVQGLGY
jgi:hypothetical protein